VKRVSGGVIFEIKEFGVYDGPGLRLTVFMKGCPLRCTWCHNPEGLSPKPEVFRDTRRCRLCGLCGWKNGKPNPEICPENLIKAVGRTVTARELAETIIEYADFILPEGGVTFSGGEPLFQYDFLKETLALLPKKLHKAMETCAFAPSEQFAEIAGLLDLVYIDLKHMDEREHKRLTGQSNRLILQNLSLLKRRGCPFIVRIPLIPGLTDTRENLSAAAEFLSDAAGTVKVELLSYNQLTGAKYASLGLEYEPGFDEKRPINQGASAFGQRGIECTAF
jgi:pyruvate formate lyase activating enzyme